MMQQFQNPLLFIKSNDPKVLHATKTVISYLHQQKINIALTAETADLIQHTDSHHIIDLDNLKSHAIDCLIVIGGDGSLLSSSKIAAKNQLPVIGINLGSVGFLTDVMPTDLRTLGAMLAGQYQKETRHFIEVSIDQGPSRLALNDVVVSRQAARLLDFEIFINQEFICSQRADGQIIATPTGSTAYALSAGGPIIHPRLNALSLVSLCPHRLNSRPIVVPENHQIDVYLANENSQTDALISCDGVAEPQQTVQCVSVQQSETYLTLLHPLQYHYFEALKSKLHWERTTHSNE